MQRSSDAPPQMAMMGALLTEEIEQHWNWMEWPQTDTIWLHRTFKVLKNACTFSPRTVIHFLTLAILSALVNRLFPTAAFPLAHSLKKLDFFS